MLLLIRPTWRTEHFVRFAIVSCSTLSINPVLTVLVRSFNVLGPYLQNEHSEALGSSVGDSFPEMG